MAYKRNNGGFTVVELMIAISVFATAMTLILAGVIFISRQYQQTSNKVQLEDASRTVHQQITQSIQFSGRDVSAKIPNGQYSARCVGNYMYIYSSAEPVSNQTVYASMSEGLYVKDNANNCAASDINITGATNLLPKGAKVVKFEITTTGTTSSLSTTFSKSPADILVFSGPGDVRCDSASKGREFCATVTLDSTATRRIGN
jgi:prepilin-type N-terminal cleavage/methylation domain-containing protein